MRDLLVVSLILLSVACGPRAERHEVPRSDDVASTPLPGLRMPYELFGAPGPWWRDDARRGDFDADARACVTHSNRARREAAPALTADTAYRAFIDCMGEHGWTRGFPPTGPDPAS